jgi:hypothetical protein
VGTKGLVVGNIGKEAPEIEVLPTEQPVPAERESVPAQRESVPAQRESRPAQPARMPESEPVPA